jgi:hypothetical protein
VSRTKLMRKEKAADRGIIPIPNLAEDDENIELSDQDIALFADFGQAVGFLKKLDHEGLMRYISPALICSTLRILSGARRQLKNYMN